ncbi:MAG: U32 family peptidase, partial [Bariatricus sp.]
EEKLYAYLYPYYRQGLDAVIVQDIGVLRFIRKKFPDLPVHASTQMTITGADGAKLLEKEGVTRVVTARELGIEEVRKIAEETNLEIESFVHGALCYCYSGQCLFSSFLGGRSGNRGQCAQPCRLLYQAEGDDKSRYLLSLKDICTLDLIPEMVEAGIDSFKIEGRMKKPEYVAAVAHLYRKYTDLYLELIERAPEGTEPEAFAKQKFRVEEEDRRVLLDLYNRGGFHTGYYHTQNGREMVSLDRPNHAGIPAVKVLKKSGRNIECRALIDLNPQDIIELPMRRGQEKADNYTCKTAVKKGAVLTIPAFADTPAQKGAVFSRVRNELLIQNLHEMYVDRKIKEKIKGIFILSVGDSAKLTVSYGDICLTVCSDVVQEAVNQPVDAERVKKQLEKTGNTPFEFEELQIEITGNAFLPMQKLNEIRREALEKLECRLTERYRRKDPDTQDIPVNASAVMMDSLIDSMLDSMTDSTIGSMPEHRGFTASARTLEQIRVLAGSEMIYRIYADCAAFPKIWENEMLREVIRDVQGSGKEIWLIMPYIFREETRKRYDAGYDHILNAGWDGIMIRNYESYGFLKEHGFEGSIMTEYNLYQFNREGLAFWKEKGIYGFTAPLELTARELESLPMQDGELILYGHLPMMVSAGCVRKTLGRCKKESSCMTITDRYRKQFMVQNECDYCYNVIYNQVPLYLADRMHEADQIGAGGFRLMFTVENARQTGRILQLYEKEAVYPDGEFTRGHWKKGIK